VFLLFNGASARGRALAFAARLVRETDGRAAALSRAFRLALGRPPSASEARLCLAHWDEMTARHRALSFPRPEYPREVVREAVEENTGETFRFTERLDVYDEFVPDLSPCDAGPEVRGLADVCLVLFNSNEFAYLD
jgi:hypothetical protein